jgi:hypothetical protein
VRVGASHVRVRRQEPPRSRVIISVHRIVQSRPVIPEIRPKLLRIPRRRARPLLPIRKYFPIDPTRSEYTACGLPSDRQISRPPKYARSFIHRSFSAGAYPPPPGFTISEYVPIRCPVAPQNVISSLTIVNPYPDHTSTWPCTPAGCPDRTHSHIHIPCSAPMPPETSAGSPYRTYTATATRRHSHSHRTHTGWPDSSSALNSDRTNPRNP